MFFPTSVLLLFLVTVPVHSEFIDLLYTEGCPLPQCKCSRHYHYIDCRGLNGTKLTIPKMDSFIEAYYAGINYNIIDFRFAEQECLPPFSELKNIFPDLVAVLIDFNPNLCCKELINYAKLGVTSPVSSCNVQKNDLVT